MSKTTPQKDQAILNAHQPNSETSNYRRQKWAELKEKMHNSNNTDINNPLSDDRIRQNKNQPPNK